MWRKIGNRWVEHRDPINLMDCSSNMEIGLCWCRKETNNKWTYNHIDHLMKNLESTFAIASMKYIIVVIDLDAYELHPGMKNIQQLY